MSSLLNVTLLDVGWGDSIFLQSLASDGSYHFGLIDSNDTKYNSQSKNFLTRYFRRHKEYTAALVEPFFDFVMLSHNHEDHGAGLEAIMKEFGTRDFWYPHTEKTATLAKLLTFADKQVNKANGCIKYHEAIEAGKPLPMLGDVKMNILWPPKGHDYEHATPNNTSIVITLELGDHIVVLTGDAEKEVWEKIASDIPRNTRFFKVPHHGSVNGTFDEDGNTTWYKKCYRYSRLGISGDVSGNFIFPNKEVITLFENDNRKYFRTDEHYHISFETNGSEYRVKYSH